MVYTRLVKIKGLSKYSIMIPKNEIQGLKRINKSDIYQANIKKHLIDIRNGLHVLQELIYIIYLYIYSTFLHLNLYC